MEKAINVPILKKGNSSFVSNYRPISLLNNFSKVFEFVVHSQMSHYFTSKLNPNQHDFVKMKSTTTNLVTYLDFISPLVSSQRQVDSIYYDFSSALEFFPHSVLLHKLCAYGLSDSHVNWFRIYLTDLCSSVRILGAFSSLSLFLQVFHKDLYWVLFFSVYLLMTSAV
jgi:hypothetical protein